MKRRAAVGIAVLLVAFGGWQAGGGLWIYAKAALAQRLIQSAWADAKSSDGAARPWPWADTVPVARLTVPTLGIDQIVLAGTSGRTLAFGPGHMDGTPLPGTPGLSVISGHRDTHFRFLEKIRTGQTIVMADAAGRVQHFRVTGAGVVDSRNTGLAIEDDIPRLALVTCYPFGAIRPGGPLRYVVFAESDRTSGEAKYVDTARR